MKRWFAAGCLVSAVLLCCCISGDDLQNPFDPRSDPSAWKPTDFSAEVKGPNTLTLSWKQKVTPVDGFQIAKVVAGTEQIISVSASARSYTDAAILPPDVSGCVAVSYSIRAYAGANQSANAELGQQFQVPLTSAAAAGPDLEVLAIQVNIAANSPAAGEEGVWSVVSGTGGQFTDAKSPATTFTGSPFVSYVLRWSITGPCSVSTDDLSVLFRQLPSVNTGQPAQVSYFTASVPGEVLADGGSPVTARGICFGTAPAPTISGNKVTTGAGTGAFTADLTGLTGGTLYFARAFATNSGGTQYGNEVSFTTLEPEWTAVNGGVSKDFSALTWVNSSVGFIAGDGVVLRTTNGGNAWTKIRESQTLKFTAVAFSDVQNGYLGANDQYFSYIFKTTDGGNTWAQVDRGWAQNEPLRVATIFVNGASVAALINQSRIYGTMLTSTNSGVDWTVTSSPKGGLNAGDVEGGKLYIGSSVFWDFSLYKTRVYTSNFLNNGSLTISQATVDGLMETSGLDMYGTYGMACGDAGKLLVTGDGGSNWNLRTINGFTSTDLTSVRYTNAQTVYVSGPGGLLLRSNDGGLTWSKTESGTTSDVTAIGLSPDGRPWAVGAKGLILKGKLP